MKTNDITKAKNPALRGSLNALRRSADAALQGDEHGHLGRAEGAG